MKAKAAVNGFVAEGSVYETEKEIGRRKRKKRRNRLFEDSESDEEIKKCKKKLSLHLQVFLSNVYGKRML